MFLFFYVKTLVKRRFDVDQYGHGPWRSAGDQRRGVFHAPRKIHRTRGRVRASVLGRGTRPGAEQDNGHAPAGFFDAAMLSLPELEYTGIMAKLKTPNTRVRVRRD